MQEIYLEDQKEHHTNASGEVAPYYTTKAHSVKMLRELHGNELVTEFGPLKLQVFRKEMIASGRVSRLEINRRISRIKSMWGWGVSMQLLPADAKYALEDVKGLRAGVRGTFDCPKVKPVPQHIVSITLNHCGEVLADMIKLHELTGMRPNELCIMRPCDIDRTLDPWLYEPSKHKMEWKGKDRKIYLGPQDWCGEHEER